MVVMPISPQNEAIIKPIEDAFHSIGYKRNLIKRNYAYTDFISPETILRTINIADGDNAFFNDLVGSVNKGYAHKIFLLFIHDIRNQGQDVLCTFDLYGFFEKVSSC